MRRVVQRQSQLKGFQSGAWFRPAFEALRACRIAQSGRRTEIGRKWLRLSLSRLCGVDPGALGFVGVEWRPVKRPREARVRSDKARESDD